jgi:hypothetical protein
MLIVSILGAVDAVGEDWLLVKACLEGTDMAPRFGLLIFRSDRRREDVQVFPPNS